MPYLQIQTNVTVDETAKLSLLPQASQVVAQALGKPESYVMVALEDNVPMLFAGTDASTAFLSLKSLRLSHTQTAALSQTLCRFIEEQLNVPQARIYIEFASPEPIMWGWQGRTF